ncbi:hypothetical protein ACFZC1_34875 [Streptomyces rubiginosohelvolus]|uniref:hypothetical protein n=1 Tax=Streptomyces rubiginosohelvolus TaxID=67362 RepID=UPI0036ED08D5
MSVSSTALFILLLALAAVVPPTVSSVKCWWSIRLRRWSGSVREAWAWFVAWLRKALLRFLNGGDGR